MFINVLEWDQYDGVMTREPEDESAGFLKNISKTFQKLTGRYYEKILNQTKLAVSAMLPSWEEISTTQDVNSQGRAERFLEKYDQVVCCVKNSFLNEEAKTDDSKMKEVTKTFLLLFSHLQSKSFY